MLSRCLPRRVGAQRRYASQSLRETAAPPFNPSLAQQILFKSSTPRVPLDEKYPSAPALSDPLSLAAAPAQISTLSSGLRVATIENNSPISSVGVFIDAGSRYEDRQLNGIFHFLEGVALKSTSNRTEFRLVRDMLKIAANVSCTSSREHFTYTGEALRHLMPSVLASLADVITNSTFDIETLNEYRATYEANTKERLNNPDAAIMEAIHEAAYGSSSVGLSIYAPSHNLTKFDTPTLLRLVTEFFTPKRMVVAGMGVDHQELSELSELMFKDLPAGSSIVEKTPTQYVAGEVRTHKGGDTGLAHVALAFPTASWHDKDLVPMCVLQMLMGGGGAFSAGGPGKGMYSRLYQNVLVNHGWVENAQSFNSIFSDAGLFGVYGSTRPDYLGSLVEILGHELHKAAVSFTPDEVNRAKNQLKSAIHMQTESRTLALEDLGRQVLIYGKVKSLGELCNEIDTVTDKDLLRVAQDMFKNGPAVAAIGDLSSLPRYETIRKYIE